MKSWTTNYHQWNKIWVFAAFHTRREHRCGEPLWKLQKLTPTRWYIFSPHSKFPLSGSVRNQLYSGKYISICLLFKRPVLFVICHKKSQPCGSLNSLYTSYSTCWVQWHISEEAFCSFFHPVFVRLNFIGICQKKSESRGRRLLFPLLGRVALKTRTFTPWTPGPSPAL